MSALRSNIAEMASVFCSMQEAWDKLRKTTTQSERTLAEDKIKHKWVIKKPLSVTLKCFFLKRFTAGNKGIFRIMIVNK